MYFLPNTGEYVEDVSGMRFDSIAQAEYHGFTSKELIRVYPAIPYTSIYKGELVKAHRVIFDEGFYTPKDLTPKSCPYTNKDCGAHAQCSKCKK